MPIALTVAGRFRFPKICSQFKIPEIANFDGKTGKMLIGYERVSTGGQDLALQTDAQTKLAAKSCLPIRLAG